MENSIGRKKLNRKKVFALGIMLAVVLSLIPISVYATGTKLSVSSAVLSKGDKLNLNVNGDREEKGTYTSSDKKVATVTKKGVVTAKKSGTATISWTKGKKILTCNIKVVKAPGLDQKELVIGKGEQKKISVKKHGNASLKTTWATKNKAIATVKGGMVTGISEGKTTVTAKIQGNRKTWTRKATVTVSKADQPTSSGSVVYMTENISPEGLMAAYQALGWTPTGKVAVKLSTGEPPASNYLRPELIKDLVQSVHGTIVECNTAYGGSRTETAMHYQVAKDHGFTEIADVDILDEEGSVQLPVTGGSYLKTNYVGSHFTDYDSYIVLSHFKGHAMAGFGGAIKNISIGLGSKEGKCLIHTGGESHTSPWGGDQTAFTESMAEAGKSVSDSLGNGARIIYVSVLNNISIDCDCDGNPSEPDIHDIGILASTDPVAIDQAAIDLCFAAEGSERLQQRVAQQNGLHTLEHAQKIGLGSRTYKLVSIDE